MEVLEELSALLDLREREQDHLPQLHQQQVRRRIILDICEAPAAAAKVGTRGAEREEKEEARAALRARAK